jgi:thioredoxin 1
VLEALEAEIPGIRIGKVNVDEEGALAMRFGISSIPFVAAFRNGQLTATSLGYVSAATLKSRLGL